MGFVKEAAKFALSPAAFVLGKKKKKPEAPKIPTMISTMPYDRPSSMIGSPRGGGGY